MTSATLKLFCLILGPDASDNDIFEINILDTEIVYGLKEAIKAENQVEFQHVDADALDIWKLEPSILVDDLFDEKIKNLNLDGIDPLCPLKRLSGIFTALEDEHLHVVVGAPPTRKHCFPDPEDIFDRLKRAKITTATPSHIAKPSIYEQLQRDPSQKILDDRPQPDADIPPIPLLYKGFGHFLDITDGHDDVQVPGLADIDVRELRKAVDDLASRMTGHFDTQAEHMDAALSYLDRIFSARTGIEIPSLWESAIGRSSIMAHSAGAMVVNFKNCITEINTIPEVEIAGYIARLIATTAEGSDSRRELYLRWRVPYLGLTIVGCDIRFYAILAIDHRFRLVNLTPKFSCIKSASDGRDRTSLYRAFTAASVLQAHILQDVKDQLNNLRTTPIIPASARHFPTISQLRKYPPSGDSPDYLPFTIRCFFPDRQPYRLLYVAELETLGTDGLKQLVLVKFVRHYSIELHDFCAQSGHAPSILAFERLPGGWYALAMEFIDSGLPITDPRVELPAYRERWIKELEDLVDSFHAKGLVHGDLRDANIICKGDSVMLIDFDWGGKDGEVFYPTVDLNDELVEGRTTEDLVIRREDDKRVLRRTLDKLVDG